MVSHWLQCSDSAIVDEERALLMEKNKLDLRLYDITKLIEAANTKFYTLVDQR